MALGLDSLEAPEAHRFLLRVAPPILVPPTEVLSVSIPYLPPSSCFCPAGDRHKDPSRTKDIFFSQGLDSGVLLSFVATNRDR